MKDENNIARGIGNSEECIQVRGCRGGYKYELGPDCLDSSRGQRRGSIDEGSHSKLPRVVHVVSTICILLFERLNATRR